MSETGSQLPCDTVMTPSISEDRLKSKAVLPLGHYAESPEDELVEGFLVKMPTSQMTVTFRLNTKRLVERREIKRANQTIRRTGR